jgi:hypothetical protein
VGNDKIKYRDQKFEKGAFLYAMEGDLRNGAKKNIYRGILIRDGDIQKAMPKIRDLGKNGAQVEAAIHGGRLQWVVRGEQKPEHIAERTGRGHGNSADQAADGAPNVGGEKAGDIVRKGVPKGQSAVGEQHLSGAGESGHDHEAAGQESEHQRIIEIAKPNRGGKTE